jgi:hypothetical protein
VPKNDAHHECWRASAQQQNRQRGIPNVYSINGTIYYELPDGSLSREDPWQGRTTPSNDERDGNDSNADAQAS